MINPPQINYIKCRNHKEEYRMFYSSWGSQELSNKTIICVHGLNRNSRDWDYIGDYFSKKDYYVVAPDIVGRGNSDYLNDPMGYDIPFYVADIFHLIHTLGLKNVDFLGTSMGGLIAMAMASMSHNTIRKMILNDIGAEIEKNGLARIAGYNTKQPVFDTYTSAKDYLISISGDFGELPNDVWENYALNSLQKNSLGKYELKRDVNLVKQLTITAPSDKNMDLWAYWDKVTIPTLVIRGELSDILSVKTLQRMQEINPETQVVEIANAGHAPFLYSEEHFSFLEKFLGA